VEPSARSRSRPVSWRSLLMAARNASRCGRIASKLLTVVWRRRATSGASAADPDATVYVCIHTFMILYIHTYMYVHVYIYMCTYIHIYVYAHTHISICVYTRTYININIHIHVSTASMHARERKTYETSYTTDTTRTQTQLCPNNPSIRASGHAQDKECAVDIDTSHHVKCAADVHPSHDVQCAADTNT